ncbi:SpoIIE family protein phosphatase [Streptomyces sp. ISL-44]|uniref:ATP-binding SpoIIE family protein phosphatase n=1 Tax=Streptomyces sp. ISL-44 TaxID=2819184 RepID=UPI001BE7DEB0|nr:SpoIIE family protein phosphatase [Streptomyces sp. ISL-44]MBT2542674.1 SpoIIE family protein phosphatase [Streptomyces sp. ISL-44]
MVPTGDVDLFATGPASLYTRAMTSGEPLLLTGEQLAGELGPGDPARAAIVSEHRIHSWLLVPMSARGEALGAVAFGRFKRAHPFEADDVLLGAETVARAAVCIDNSRRYTRERTTALALQRSLLPQQLPSLGSVEAVSRYLPASGHTAVGGAWFDVIPLSGARVALVVGDVPGLGVHAGAAMGRLRTAVRTLADLDVSPEELLTHLYDLVNRLQDEHSEGLTGSMTEATCLYAVFDPVSRQCVAARAGQSGPVLVSADGEVTSLDLADAPPLGHGEPPLASREFTLADGDVLALFTDGLVAAQGGSPSAGVVRLRQILAEHQRARSVRKFPPGDGLDDMCDVLIRGLLPPRPDTDVALLMVRVRGLDADQLGSWDLPAEHAIVSRARALAAEKLTDWDLEDLEFTTEVIVSELVTNAIRYGTPPIQLRLIRDRSLICEVSDGSSTSPHVRRALDTDEGGRGLFMVAQLARLWGTRYHARGKTIWAEQPFPGSPGDGVAPLFSLSLEDL